MVIEGTVADTCAGAQNLVKQGKFTFVPAMSDASQEAWMEYLYMQQPVPANATGVTVTLDAIDPNNNYVHIGTATSDMSGTFSYAWSPTIEGKYTIIATFPGSKSYGASYAETAAVVTAAPSSPTPTPPAAAPDNTPIYEAS